MSAADRTISESKRPAGSGGTPFGKYTLLKLLARGGMAEVHLAEGPNPRDEPLVCVKLMLPNLAHDREFLAMFVEEAKLAAPLAHHNLVQIDDLGLRDGRLYLAMEYIRGHALHVLHRELVQKGLLVPPELAAAAIAQACRGLDYAHEVNGPDGKPLGLVHRDISPQNLILRFDGLVKVVDFGIAKATSVSGTRTTHLKGKLPYMSPEQINGRGIDRRTDVFAMGASLFELLCGHRLFTGRTDVELIRQIMYEPIRDVRERNPEIPAELAEIVSRACERNPAKRTPSCAALADALEAFVARRLQQPRSALARLAEEHLAPLPSSRDEALAWTSPDEEQPLLELSLADVGGDGPKQENGRQTRAIGAEPRRQSRPASSTEILEEAPQPTPTSDGRSPGARAGTPAPALFLHTERTPVAPVNRARNGLAIAAGIAVALGAIAAAFAVLKPAAKVEPAVVALPPEPARPPRAAEAPPEPAPPVPAAPGRLALRTVPSARVYLEGKFLGETPFDEQSAVELPAGTHVLTLRNDAKGAYELTVEIEAGRLHDGGIQPLAKLKRLD